MYSGILVEILNAILSGDWGRNKLQMRPQPAPPIYQPEVAAEAIVFASTARRREVWVGAWTFKAILASRIAPWLLDNYLARFGYSSQLSSEPALKDAPDNLFKPIEGDYGAHGRFDAQALSSTDLRSPVLPGLLLIGSAANLKEYQNASVRRGDPAGARR